MALHPAEGHFTGGESAASHPLIIHPWLGDDEGSGEGPVPGHIAALGGRALLGSEPPWGLGGTGSLVVLGQPRGMGGAGGGAHAAAPIAIPPVSSMLGQVLLSLQLPLQHPTSTAGFGRDRCSAQSPLWSGDLYYRDLVQALTD